MFKSFRIRNFRTHVDTKIDLQDITLIIGSNNTGKSNWMAAVHYFSKLVRNSATVGGKEKVNSAYFFGERHKLSSNDTPMIFNCVWEKKEIKISYELQLYSGDKQKVGCRENIKLKAVMPNSETAIPVDEYEYELDDDYPTTLLMKVHTTELKGTKETQKDYKDFFNDLSSIYYYNFQSSFLKDFNKQENINSSNISLSLSTEGRFFLNIIKHLKEKEEATYDKLIALIRRFEKSFHGISIQDDKLYWQFDIDTSNSELSNISPAYVSDGLLKAGAIALLCVAKNAPSLILIEEVENGINQRKIKELLGWLWQKTTEDTQFIITSHNPSIILEFENQLDSVYNMRLMNKGYKSVVANLNESLKALYNFGTIEQAELEEVDGKELIVVKPIDLLNLFYNGTLGGL